jgi:arginase
MQDSLRFFEHQPTAKAASILGVPLDFGKDSTGTDGAPEYLRNSGLLNMLKSINVPVTDLGDVACPKRESLEMGDKRAKYLEPIAKILSGVCDTVQQEVGKGQFTIALGGDHTIAIGVISGAVAALPGDTGVIYIDAHPDANTPESSLSGNIHGMVTTALCGEGPDALINLGKAGAKIKHENLLFLGVKDFDQAEIDWIRARKITAVTPLDVVQHGLDPIFKAISELSKRVKNVWVSFDIDSMDHQFAPATPMSTAGGFTFREIHAISKYIGKVCRVAGTDIVECMPTGEEHNKTAFTVTTFVANLLGAEYSWYTSYMEEEQRKQAQRS